MCVEVTIPREDGCMIYIMSLIRNYLIMNILYGRNETIYIVFVLIRFCIIVSVL